MDAEDREFYELVAAGIYDKSREAADKALAKQMPEKIRQWCEYYYLYFPAVHDKVERSVAGFKKVEIEDIVREVQPMLRDLMAMDYVKYRRTRGTEGCAADEGSLNAPESKDGDDGWNDFDVASGGGHYVRDLGGEPDGP